MYALLKTKANKQRDRYRLQKIGDATQEGLKGHLGRWQWQAEDDSCAVCPQGNWVQLKPDEVAEVGKESWREAPSKHKNKQTKNTTRCIRLCGKIYLQNWEDLSMGSKGTNNNNNNKKVIINYKKV